MQTLDSIKIYIESHIDALVPIDMKTICKNFYSRVHGAERPPLEALKEILKTNIIITQERKEFIFLMIKHLQLFLGNNPYWRKHLITGMQGIGKSYSLLLLAHCLKLKDHQQYFHVVMISECQILLQNEWDYVINEFKIAFPNQSKQFDEIPDKEEKTFLRKFLEKAKQEKRIIILIVDQINWAYGKGDEILADLLCFEWTMIVVSESANNNIKPDKRYKEFDRHEYISMVSEKSVPFIIQTEFEHIKFQTTDFEKIIKMSKFIPREAMLICQSTGESIEEKVSHYQLNRLEDFQEIHRKFKSQLNSHDHPDLLKSIFHMDKDCFVEYDDTPIIDKQLMICERKKAHSKCYKILSILPMVHDFLKQDLNSREDITKYDQDYYSKRIKEVKSMINNSLIDSRVKGVCFEELITLRFHQSYLAKEKMDFKIQTAKYLSTQNPINYKVFFNIFSINVFLTFLAT